MAHTEPHPAAGSTVKLRWGIFKSPSGTVLSEADFDLTDWSDRVAVGSEAVEAYAERSGIASLPVDDDVVVGAVDGVEHLIHVTEIDEEA